jgi:hypothetical protein
VIIIMIIMMGGRVRRGSNSLSPRHAWRGLSVQRTPFFGVNPILIPVRKSAAQAS